MEASSTRRVIVGAEGSKAAAQWLRDKLSKAGRRPRVYERYVRAESLAMVCWVIVADEETR